MIDALKKRLFESEPFKRFEDLLNRDDTSGPLLTTGIHGSLMAFVVSQMHAVQPRQLLVVVPDRDRAEKLRDDCHLLTGTSAVHLYIHARHHTGTLLDMTGPVMQMETLRALANGEQVITIASAEALASPVPSPPSFRNRTLVIEAGSEHPFQQLLETLTSFGFERKDVVEAYGDVAVRGGIVDIFPFVGEHPIRIEFWGDVVESIREFDALSQRSIRELRSAAVVANFSDPGDGTEAEGRDQSLLFSYLDPRAIMVLDEPVLAEQEITRLRKEGIDSVRSWETVMEEEARWKTVVHSNLAPGDGVAVDFSSHPQPPFNGSVRFLVENLIEQVDQGFSGIISCDTEEELRRLKELMEEELKRTERADLWSSLTMTTEALHSGFVFRKASTVLYTEHEIFNRLKRRGLKKRSRFKGFSQREVYRLKRGDYVVHTDYGVGRFAGLQTIKVRGADQEVMKILYEDQDALYVNLNYINRVQKYSSQEGHEPALTKLGTPQWDRLRSRARKKIKDIARGLIRLYALRKRDPGFAFSPDSHWQKEMEASFMFEDTPDQAAATEAVKADMEQPMPMDRLICGDVGFGKTEVAVRAAFKAVLDGKQVAVLVPTTILAQQHHHTFMDRLARYTVRVEHLTRFKSRTEQKEILEALQERKVDVVIGTHRLLSKDIAFKDLGLLIVDEEHRFGVSAKEKLRQMRASVDTLTLTATPIPRTLQFSLMGARDLSIINTPPRNRLAIITEIAQFDMKLIREAILNELHRGGQVYFIHDRIQNMGEVLTKLQKAIPEARFHSAHGQMKGHELEQAMVAFLEKKYDVLVCTKIIESGIDIPSVNTIIINRADRFGLAELYQLRGRVGRSNIQAYAYLLTPPLTLLPRATLQRLQAIQEFTELGSGFNLAMRDMEIRGAGNLLGAQQSGFIMEMGFEMYQKIVEEAVAELKQEEFGELFKEEAERPRPVETDTIVETDVEALIPEVYVESDMERLDLYRRLYQARSMDDVQMMREEIGDRFGEYPPEVEHLFRIVELKVVASKLRFRKVELSKRLLVLSFPDAEQKDFYEGGENRPAAFQAIMEAVGRIKGYQSFLKQDGAHLRLHVRLGELKNEGDRLRRVQDFLAVMRTIVDEQQPF